MSGWFHPQEDQVEGETICELTVEMGEKHEGVVLSSFYEEKGRLENQPRF